MTARKTASTATPHVTRKPGGALSPRRAHGLVGEIAKRYFGERPRRIVRRGGGLTNLVFEFRAAGADYVVRLHADPAQLNHYLKEQWAMVEARRVGVPTPEVLEVDNQAVELPYMVMKRVDGVDAAHHPDRLRLVGELGRLAARLHGVRTQGFGEVFDWSSNRLSRRSSWGSFLDEDFNVEQRIATLSRSRMLTPAQAKALEEALVTMRRWRKPAVLHHGDLRLKNLVVAPDSGQLLALIDWEECLSAPAPYWDLSIALHDLNPDAKEAFLDGYGITPRAYAQALPFMRALNTLNYSHAVERLRRHGEHARLAWYRTRLQGLFDLYL